MHAYLRLKNLVKSARDFSERSGDLFGWLRAERVATVHGYVTGDYDGIFAVAKQRSSCLHNTSTVLIGQEGGRRLHCRLFHGDTITLIISARWLLATCRFPNYESLFHSPVFRSFSRRMSDTPNGSILINHIRVEVIRLFATNCILQNTHK